MVTGDGRAVTYTAFDKALSFTKGSNTVTLTHGPSRARVSRVDQTASGTKTTYYVGGKAFERIELATETHEKHYIGNFAVITKVTDSGAGSLATNYLHHDHLGSTDTITNEAGAVVQQVSFDATKT